MEAEGDSSNLIFLILLVGIGVALLFWSERVEPNLKHLPSLGGSGYLLSYFDALSFVSNATAILKRGYQKFHPRMFKISNFQRYLVIVTSTQNIEDIRKATEEQLSFMHAVQELGTCTATNLFEHEQIVLAHNLGEFMLDVTCALSFIVPAIREGIVAGFQDAVPTVAQFQPVWTRVNAVDAITDVVVRSNTRAFLGYAASQDNNLTVLGASLAKSAFQVSLLSKMVPSLARLKSYFKERQLQKEIRALVRNRKLSLKTNSDGKISDVLSWIIGRHSGWSDEKHATQIFSVSMVANKSIPLSVAHALYHLAANPRYALPLRKEVEGIVLREGWTKCSFDKMRKLDSFVKESMRLNGVESLSMMRKVQIPFTFSDGTLIPAGAFICVAAHPRHLDKSIYPNPEEFEEFRFSQPYEQHHEDDRSPDLSGETRFQHVTTTADYLAWGYGKHACPGRFFASMMMKMVLAHIIMNYDVRFEDGIRPKDILVGLKRIPDPNAKILFRKR